MKLYIVGPGKTGTDNIEGNYVLVNENGEVLYSHYCSSKCFAKEDLITERPERMEECKQKYGDFEVLYLGEDEMTFDKLLELNKKIREEKN